jgi:magnesium transporter
MAEEHDGAPRDAPRADPATAGSTATPEAPPPVPEPTIGAFRAAMAAGDLDRAGAIATELALGDLRDALRELTPEQTEALLQALGDERLASLVEELDPEIAGDILRRLPDAQAADVLEEMAPDDAADVVAAIEAEAPDTAQAILVEMEPEEAGDVRALLAYPPNTAGGRMTPEFFAVSPQVTADEAIQGLRAVANGAEFRSYIYVIDPVDRLLGVVPLYRLVLVPPETRVAEIMVPDPIHVRVTDDQEEVARIFREHRFLAVPVVDEAGRLVGVVTADDIADVLEEEATEDIERLGGSQPLDEPYLRASPLTLARKRVGWLLLLFVAEAYTGTVLRHFEDELQQVIALAFFIPLLIGTGGNTGSQTVTTVIRAMAVGEVVFRDIFRVWRKELGTALLLSLAMAGAATIRAWTLGVPQGVALTVALAAATIVVWAATVAALLPLVLRRLRIDPAVVSAPLITTLVDGTGLVIYFEIARRVLAL